MLPDFGSSSVSRVPLHPQEAERLDALCGICVPDEGRDLLLDRVAESAAALFDAPIGLVSFVRERDQLFAGRTGTDLEGAPREESFCAHTILHDGPLVVEDAREDPRFAHLEVVARPPHVRAYFGAPVLDVTGLPLGSVCVLDVKPRQATFQQLVGLERLAAKVGVILETRRLVRETLGGSGSDYRGRTLRRLELVLAPLGAPLDEPRRRS